MSSKSRDKRPLLPARAVASSKTYGPAAIAFVHANTQMDIAIAVLVFDFFGSFVRIRTYANHSGCYVH
jgi:hypothetical protein